MDEFRSVYICWVIRFQNFGKLVQKVHGFLKNGLYKYAGWLVSEIWAYVLGEKECRVLNIGRW